MLDMEKKNENLFEEFISDLKKEMEAMGHVNLIITGKTGVGKSTLINNSFRKNMADTGVGSPVTDKIRKYHDKDFPLVIYDTVGLELDADKQEAAVKEIKDLCEKQKLSGDENEYIHVMWYCVDGNGARFEPYELNYVNEIAKEMPVVIVLTKCIIKNVAEKLKKEIEKKNSRAVNVMIVRAEKYTDDEGKDMPAFGVEELVEFTCSLLPEAKQKAWTNAQSASLKLKEKMATKVVNQTVIASFGEGYVPLPCSDCVLLIPTQISMIARITAIYGLELSEAMFTGIVSSLLGTAGTTFVGRTAVANILKTIPGVGTAVGGTISGATAALLTKALGEAYIVVMDMVCREGISESDLESGKLMELLSSIFKEKLGIAK